MKVRSKFEKSVADDLTVRGYGFLYEKEKIKYTIPASDHVYTPDFKVKHRSWVIEVKGVLDLPTRQKMIHVKNSNPDKDIRLIFQRDNVIRKGSNTKYSDWAKANGFKYAIGKVPQEWLDE